jgi:hypothetical protein
MKDAIPEIIELLKGSDEDVRQTGATAIRILAEHGT